MLVRMWMLVMCSAFVVLSLTGCADKTDDGDGDDGSSAVLMQMQQDGGQSQSVDEFEYQ